MTNGDAIKAMFPDVEVKEKNNGYEVYFGIGTAIQFFNYKWWNAPYEALEQQPCEDCISRQKALDTIGNVPDYDDGMVWEALSHAQRDVALLPSVTPSYNSVKTELKPCEDCVSREAIMDLIDEMGDDFYSPREAVVSLDYMADAINELPPVKPQPIYSKWISVEEQFPNVGDRVLVCYPGEFVPYKIDITIYSRHGFEISPCVEAWQPLPEPLDKSNI